MVNLELVVFCKVNDRFKGLIYLSIFTKMMYGRKADDPPSGDLYSSAMANYNS